MLESFASFAESDLPIPIAAIGSHPAAPEAGHPLIHIHRIVGHVCAERGAFLPAPEPGMSGVRLIRAALLQSLYAFACNDQLMEQLRYNALYRWFVGLEHEEPRWEAATYVRALNVLRGSQEGGALFRTALLQAHALASLVPGRFRVDGALLHAWTRPSCCERPDAAGSVVTSTVAPDDLSLARLERARSVIERRIGDPSLCPDLVAHELCMSRRALYLLFEKHGMTPTRAIREIRLDSCRKMLSDSRHLHRKITDIAMDFGFEDPGSFSRQFKVRYGFSPRDARLDRQPIPEVGERAARYRASTHRMSIAS